MLEIEDPRPTTQKVEVGKKYGMGVKDIKAAVKRVLKRRKP